MCAQVLPHIVHGLVEDGGKLTRMVGNACRLGMRLYRRNLPPGHTVADLRQIDTDLNGLSGDMQELYGVGYGAVPKWHKVSHSTTDVRRLGHPKHATSDPYEHDHAVDKRLYR
jgi:hypothetical protein